MITSNNESTSTQQNVSQDTGGQSLDAAELLSMPPSGASIEDEVLTKEESFVVKEQNVEQIFQRIIDTAPHATIQYFASGSISENIICYSEMEEENLKLIPIQYFSSGSVNKNITYYNEKEIPITYKNMKYSIGSAIQMWMNTLRKLCDENSNNSHTNDYNLFIVNMLNCDDNKENEKQAIENKKQVKQEIDNNPEREKQVKQAIDDFYDYFYINEHIYDVNYISSNLNEFDNNYGTGIHKLKLLDTLKKIEYNAKCKSIFKDITIYVFNLIVSFGREKLGLQVFEDTDKDEYICKYYTKYIHS
jgi:hypothetical protein